MQFINPLLFRKKLADCQPWINSFCPLKQNIKDSFKAKKKDGAVIVRLTAAYDTSWHQTVTTAFNLNKQETKCGQKVYNDGELVSFCFVPNYCGLKLEKLFTFFRHLVTFRRKKYPFRVTAKAI